MADRSRGQPVPPRGVSFRAVLISLAAAPLNAYWITYTYWHFGYASEASLIYSNCVCYLVGLVGINALLRRWRPRWSFSVGELLTIYLLLSISTAWCGVDFVSDLPEAISNPFWFATPSNQWGQLVLPYLPTWLTVSDPDVISGLFEGDASFYRRHVLLAWLEPALWWTAMATALMLAYVSLSSILRRRWCDEEKLLFPAATVPLQIAEERHTLFRSRALWGGLLLAAGVETVNLIHGLFPAFPEIPLSWDLRPYIEGLPPWNAIRCATVGVWPTVVGICYLMPLDLAFSLWFFNLWFKAQLILATHFGWTTDTISGFPYIDNQSLGGFIALLASVLWLDRRYLVQVARKALGLPSALDESHEAMSYRWAVIALAAAIGFLAYFFGRGGMPLWLAMGWIANFLLLGLAVTRIRAQLAPPAFELWNIGPNNLIPMLIGTETMTPRAQGMMWITYPMARAFGSNPQPWTLEAFKLAESERTERRRLSWALVGITPVVILSMFWATLHVVYGVGVASNADPYAGDHVLDVPYYLAGALENPTGPDYAALGAIAAGMATTVALMAMKMQFLGWPLHPVALPIACSWVMDAYVAAVFVAWLMKAAIMRYGGLRLHRLALPFFLGLIVGSAMVSFLRTIIACVLDVPL
ncbi:MAG: hypothetical protein MUQ65_05560 [Armatimonadetes bacterium]|nr:hypothetical protein [Armatimonadota bacterium]